MNSSYQPYRTWKRKHNSEWDYYTRNYEDKRRYKYEKRYNNNEDYYYNRHRVEDRYSDPSEVQRRNLEQLQNQLQQIIEDPNEQNYTNNYTQHHVEYENTQQPTYENRKWFKHDDVSLNTTEQDNNAPEEEFSINFVVTPEDILGSNSLSTLESNVKLEPLDDFESQNTENSNSAYEIQQIKCEPLTIPCQENKTSISNNKTIRNINLNKRAFVHLLLQARIDNLQGLNKDLAVIAAKIIDSQDEVIINLLHENNSLKNTMKTEP